MVTAALRGGGLAVGGRRFAVVVRDRLSPTSYHLPPTADHPFGRPSDPPKTAWRRPFLGVMVRCPSFCVSGFRGPKKIALRTPCQ